MNRRRTILPRPTAPQVHREDRSGCDVIGVLAGGALRAHRNGRGNISLLFVFMSLVFYCCASLVWNTGRTTAAVMHTQTAADASAYSAAMWTSRAVNNITGANMLILRNASAQVAASAVISTTVLVPVNWLKWCNDMASGCGPFYPICFAAALAYVVAVELPPYIKFVAKAAPTAFRDVFSNKYPKRIKELWRYEKAWVNATPGAIESQRKLLEEYYNCKIHFTRPGSTGQIKPPLEVGDFLSLGAVLAMRFWVFKHDNTWPKEGNFDIINRGKANQSWNIGAGLASGLMPIVHGEQHYVLPTQQGPLEFGPTSLDDWKDFTVIATAVTEDASAGALAMPGIFSDPITPGDGVIAYAQAETYNGIDGRLNQIGFSLPYPFRVWTTWGWQWQPRLTRGDQLRNALAADPALRAIFARIDVTSADWNDLDKISLH